MGIIFILFQMHEGDDDQQIEYSWPYPHPSPTASHKKSTKVINGIPIYLFTICHGLAER